MIPAFTTCIFKPLVTEMTIESNQLKMNLLFKMVVFRCHVSLLKGRSIEVGILFSKFSPEFAKKTSPPTAELRTIHLTMGTLPVLPLCLHCGYNASLNFHGKNSMADNGIQGGLHTLNILLMEKILLTS